MRRPASALPFLIASLFLCAPGRQARADDEALPEQDVVALLKKSGAKE
jgi:hypothetical protein